MRILCIADDYPWPPTNGLRIRLSNIVGGLATAGDVDLFCAVSDRSDLDADVEPSPDVRRLLIHHRDRYRPSVRGVPRWLRSGWPRAVAWRDWDGPRDALARWAAPPYDVVWYGHAHTWLGLGDTELGPAIVDLDNLEDEIMARLLDLGSQLDLGETPTLRTRMRRVIGRQMARLDIRRWRRAHADVIARAARTVVCSEVDRSRLGDPTATIIPNGFELDRAPAPRAGSAAPVLMMVGHFIYEPNIDGAHFFAKHVLPLVRKRVPAARFVLAGRHEGALDDLSHNGAVTVLGQVDDLAAGYATAATVVIPLRSGSGTRIKVLEAFAYGVPVASTSLGCEGLGVRDEHEVLIGDTPEGLAEACVRLLTDERLAASVAESGRRLWEQRYQWSTVRGQIRDVAVEVAG